MAVVDTRIANLALSHIGISERISNLETERSKEAEVCRVFYDDVQAEIFRDFIWPFANKYFTLNLIAEDPNDEWQYSYRYPSDCAKLQKILSGIRNEHQDSRIAYDLGHDDSGKRIYTDQENACAKYTKLITDEGLYPQDMIMAFSMLLASYIAPSLSEGDPFGFSEKWYRMYLLSYGKATANALNEITEDKEPEPEAVRSRR